MAILDKRCDEHKNYAQGAITRIKLEDFVTYDSLEKSPGPNLNVIIGPNGTGKSTIVCAICLGMTGKTSVLGRAGAISDFIKYGKNRAVIEIELNNKFGKNWTVKRIITKDSRSEWFLNEKPAKLKEIEDLVNSLNIQVGNLCQFLPQEKVAEFARMNTMELLENTEKAVGGLDLYEKHAELKDQSKRTRDLEKDVEMVQESLEKEQAINNRLETQVKSFKDRRAKEEGILWLKRKMACLVYKQKKQNFDELKKQQGTFEQQIKDLNEQFDPIKEKRDSVNKKIVKQKQIVDCKVQLIKDNAKLNRDIDTKLDDFNEKVTNLKDDYALKESEFKNHKTKLATLQKDIEALTLDYDERKGDLDDIKLEELEIRERQKAVYDERDVIFHADNDLKNEKNSLERARVAAEKSIKDMKNVRQEKLNKMRQANLTQQIAAIEWLDRNRATLKGKAYEPMFLLINIKDQNYAKYVESLIPYRELTSMFLFENSEDLALFYKQSFKNVNSGLVPNKAMSAYRPRLDINDLKAHGFTTYIREQIDAPEDVLLYLCAFHQIHSIPIGSAATHKNIANILNQMPDITRCYTHTHSYSVSKSRYGGHLSTQSSDINSQSYWLSNSVDQSQIKHKESDLAQIQANLEAIDEKARNAKETLLDIERRKIDLNNKMNNAKERRLYIESLANKLKIKMTHLKTLQSQSVDLTAEAKKKLQKLNDLVKKKVKVVCDCVQQASDLVGLNKDKINAVYHHTVLQAEKSRIQELERGYISKLQELQSNHENFEENLNAASDLAKQAMKEANKINNLECTKLPDEYKRVFHTLPDTVDKLEVEITQAEAIQQCSSSVDEQVVRDFEQRAKHIERLQADVAKKRDKLLNHQDTYETTKNEWMQQVEEMIQAINDKFSGLFRQLKCAGEVSLGRPDNLEDFGRYGICIKVSFRQDEQMQELSAWLQSGGEKSVSTMMYMIALQEMTKCPFRVVDEINQGMDPINERKVFDIIVQNSCAKQFAQYFLLTPKLLPDLSFDERTNVICVFNGPHNLKHTSFDFRKFIKRRKALNE